MAWCNAWRCLPGPWAGALATIKIVCDAPKNSEAVGSSNANSLCGWNSAGSPESVRPFKGIFCDGISEFESYMASQAVRSLSASGMKGSQSIWAFEPPAGGLFR